MLTVIVPTFNEERNIRILLSRLRSALSKIDYEIIFVDDSTDTTPSLLKDEAKRDGHLRVIHRYNERGLATAVIQGFQAAKGEYLAVLDADLQHPPENLLSLLASVQGGADVAIASRFVRGGSDGGLSHYRRLVSWVARSLAKLALMKLRDIHDPTAGFFVFRASVIQNVDLDPRGWKILIEVLAKGRVASVIEVPYEFASRARGESKMSAREQWNYLRHLFGLLVNSPEDRRPFLFMFGGALGVVVNMLVYVPLVAGGLHPVFAGMISAVVAMTSNFIYHDLVTWREVKGNQVSIRAAKFFLTSGLGILLNVVILGVLYNHLGVKAVPANLLAIAAVFFGNFVLSKRWTWSTAPQKIAVTAMPPVVAREKDSNSGFVSLP